MAKDLSLTRDRPVVVVFDNDEQRAEGIVAALVGEKIPASALPLDVGRTDWSQVKKVDPLFLLADSKALEQDGEAWLQMFHADENLRGIHLLSVPFDDFFVGSSPLSIQVLHQRYPHLRGEVVARLASLQDNIDEEQEKNVDRELCLDHESGDDDDDSSFDRITPVVPESGRIASMLDEAEPISERSGVATPTARSLPPPSNKVVRNYAVVGVVALVLLGFLAGTMSQTVVSNADKAGQVSPSSQGSPGQVTILAAKGGGLAQTEEGADVQNDQSANDASLVESGELDLWAVPKKELLPECTALLSNTDELKKGSVIGAKRAWARARKALVLGQIERAQIAMCETVFINPKSLAIEALVDLFLTVQSPENALPWIEQALRLRGKRAKTLLLAGDIQSQLGRPAPAKEFFLAALGDKNTDPQTLLRISKKYTRLGREQLHKGTIPRAEKYFRRAVTLHPDNIRALVGLAQTLLLRDDRARAERWAESALARQKDQPEALVVLGDLALARSQNDKALALYHEALKAAPRNRRARKQIMKLSH